MNSVIRLTLALLLLALNHAVSANDFVHRVDMRVSNMESQGRPNEIQVISDLDVGIGGDIIMEYWYFNLVQAPATLAYFLETSQAVSLGGNPGAMPSQHSCYLASMLWALTEAFVSRFGRHVRWLDLTPEQQAEFIVYAEGLPDNLSCSSSLVTIIDARTQPPGRAKVENLIKAEPDAFFFPDLGPVRFSPFTGIEFNESALVDIVCTPDNKPQKTGSCDDEHQCSIPGQTWVTSGNGGSCQCPAGQEVRPDSTGTAKCQNINENNPPHVVVAIEDIIVGNPYDGWPDIWAGGTPEVELNDVEYHEYFNYKTVRRTEHAYSNRLYSTDNYGTQYRVRSVAGGALTVLSSSQVAVQKVCRKQNGFGRCHGQTETVITNPHVLSQLLNLPLPTCMIVETNEQIDCNLLTSSNSGTGPDLVVSNLVMENAATIRPGDAMVVSFDVSNVGQALAENSVFRLSYRAPNFNVSTQDGWVGSLQPSATRRIRMLSSDAGISLGDYGTTAISLSVDTGNVLSENSESNNSAQSSVMVWATTASGKPDLRVTSIASTVQNPVVGDAVGFNVRIENSGNAAASNVDYKIEAFTPDGNRISEEQASINQLLPGAGESIHFSHTPTVIGTLLVKVTVDSFGRIVENSESNNTLTYQLMVSDSLPCLPCTSGAPNNLIGSKMCFADSNGVAALGTMYRCDGVRADGSTCVASGNHPNGWGYAGSRCADPATLSAGTLHPDMCGTPNICPGTRQ